MSGSLLVDTDVLIDVLRGREEAIDWLGPRSRQVVLSAITVAELYAGVRGESEQAVLDDMVGLFPVLPVTFDVSKHGGLFRQRFGPSHGVGLADALIAATAVYHQALLVTLNTKHFPMLERVEMPYRKAH